MQNGFDGILMFPKNFVYFWLIGNEVAHKCYSIKHFIRFFRFFIGIRIKVNDITLKQFGKWDMAENKKHIIRIRRGIGKARYYACDNLGNPIMGFNKLSEARERWKKEIQWGHIELVRELDKTPNMETINKTIKCLQTIMRAYSKEMAHNRKRK